MVFYAKSALDKAHLDCKMRIGCDGIEIQLRDELINLGSNNGVNSYFDAKDVFDLSSFTEYPVKVVHTPVTGLNLETLIDSDFKLLDQVFFIAEYFGCLNNWDVLVVIRSESNMHHLRTLSDTWKRVLNGVGCLLLKYPHTELAIENVSPFELENNKLHLRNNFGFDNVEMALELRKQLNTDRVGTVLDTCHAMMTKMYMTALSNIIIADTFNMEDYSMRNFFEMNSGVAKLVHLANIKDDGLMKNHGVGFTNLIDSQLTLSMILGTYKVLGYNCPVTIEVSEDDFLVSNNYKTTLANVKDLLDFC